MTDRHAIRLKITASGVAAWRGDEQLLASPDAMADASAPFWPALKPLCVDQTHIDIILSAPFVLDIGLEEGPGSPAFDIDDILAVHAPLLPHALIWTDPRTMPDGQIAISIARREWAAGLAALLAGQDLPDPIFRAATDGSILHRPAKVEKRPLRQMAMVVLILLIIVPAGLALSTWRERQRLEARVDAIMMTAEARSTRPLLSARSRDRQTMADMLSHIPRAFGTDARLAAVEGTADGFAIVTIDTGDPDRLREAIRADPQLRSLREGKQSQRPDGRYDVLYSLRVTQ